MDASFCNARRTTTTEPPRGGTVRSSRVLKPRPWRHRDRGPTNADAIFEIAQTYVRIPRKSA
jgi:hypothetical protein